MPLRVVYVDDEPGMCQTFIDNFLSPNVEIIAFSDPTNIVKNVLDARPDLVILDYRLPKTSGDEIALALPAQLPKVLVTGDLSVNPAAKFLRIFTKPFDFEEIQKLIDEFVSKKVA